MEKFGAAEKTNRRKLETNLHKAIDNFKKATHVSVAAASILAGAVDPVLAADKLKKESYFTAPIQKGVDMHSYILDKERFENPAIAEKIAEMKDIYAMKNKSRENFTDFMLGAQLVSSELYAVEEHVVQSDGTMKKVPYVPLLREPAGQFNQFSDGKAGNNFAVTVNGVPHRFTAAHYSRPEYNAAIGTDAAVQSQTGDNPKGLLPFDPTLTSKDVEMTIGAVIGKQGGNVRNIIEPGAAFAGVLFNPKKFTGYIKWNFPAHSSGIDFNKMMEGDGVLCMALPAGFDSKQKLTMHPIFRSGAMVISLDRGVTGIASNVHPTEVDTPMGRVLLLCASGPEHMKKALDAQKAK